MGQHDSPGWWEGIERDVSGALYEEVSKSVPGIFSVDLDLTNGDVLIIDSSLILPRSAEEIRSVTKEAGSRLKLKPDLWNYVVRRKPAAPFVSHITYQPLWRRFGRSPSKLTLFDIKLSDLEPLHEAITELMQLSSDADVVAGFASGGVSILEQLAERTLRWHAPSDPFRYSRELRAFSLRYHLFPGLNWIVQGNKTMFDDWLATQPSGSRVLLFDTGTKGNGVRQIVKRVRAVAGDQARWAPSCVKIVGLVDGWDQAQNDEVITIQRCDNRNLVLDVSYRRVPRVLTEDCDVLRGYEVDLVRNGLLPVKDPGQLRLVTDSDRVIRRITSTSIASQYRAMMISTPEPLTLLQSSGPLTPESEKHAVKLVLGDSMRDEAVRLHQAWCMGLIGDYCYTKEKNEMPRRYEKSMERYSKEAWDFVTKKYVAR